MRRGSHRARAAAPAPRRLVVGDDHAEEAAAHQAAVQVSVGGRLARPMAGLADRSGAGTIAPASVRAALDEPGRPLDARDRSAYESALGAGLGAVRVHTGAGAARSADDVDAASYSVGRHVVLGGQQAPDSRRGRYLLAHELAHVVSADAGSGRVRRYRKASSFAFGERDTATLVEDSFDPKKDKQTKPWIEKVTVVFDGTSTDSDGNVFSTGTATVDYFANPVALPSFSLAISGGSGRMKTDAGSFTVHRIEGFGYNSGSASGTPGVDFQWSDREGPNKRYTKQDSSGWRDANMSYAVFYNKGEALHAGPLDFTSHGCVHVDWDHLGIVKRLNYHSVIGLTKVTVSYATP